MDQHFHKRDFSVNDRLLGICGLAAVIGGISTLAAVVLLGLIHLFTNLFSSLAVSLSRSVRPRSIHSARG